MERDGSIRRRVVADVTGKTLKAAIREEVDLRSRIITDEFTSYDGIGSEFKGRPSNRQPPHTGIRTRDIHTNTVESSFALVKRGIMGIYHNVSREYLHRYIWQFDFVWNNRKLNDGERIEAAIQSAEGKRLVYRAPTA